MSQPMTQSIRPQFHYSYKSQAIILDSQYNYQGSLLAVCTSQGCILLYSSQSEQSSREPIFILTQQTKKQILNDAILKLSWSLPLLGYLATCNIYQVVTLYKVVAKTLVFHKEVQVNCIPVALGFAPTEDQAILTLGCSDGTVRLYNQQFEQLQRVAAHLQVVNSIAWQTNIYALEKNKWALNCFPNILPSTKACTKSMYLLTCSSDGSIKLFRLSEHVLKLIHCVQKAHQKHVRMVDWKTNYFLQDQKTFVSCSQDSTIKIWSVKITDDKCIMNVKGSTIMKGPVYKVKYNHMANLLAVSYCNDEEQKVQTKIFKENNGALCQQLKIQN